MPQVDIDVVAALSALAGAIIGGFTASFRSGRAWQEVKGSLSELKHSVSHLDEKTTLISDELARRVTVVENRVQFDGYYTSPRVRRPRDDT